MGRGLPVTGAEGISGSWEGSWMPRGSQRSCVWLMTPDSEAQTAAAQFVVSSRSPPSLSSILEDTGTTPSKPESGWGRGVMRKESWRDGEG